jgi:hypothetical protein
MDTLSHGLWGGVAFGRESKKNFLWSFCFGVAPDIFSFGIFTAASVFGFVARPEWSAGPPPMELIPEYVHVLYNITHSFVIFAAVFFAVWLIYKKPFLPMLAWALHILIDIPTHSTAFFPTPFLWPFFDTLRIDGIPWSHPYIFIPNVALLAMLYLWFFVIKPRRVAVTSEQ